MPKQAARKARLKSKTKPKQTRPAPSGRAAAIGAGAARSAGKRQTEAKPEVKWVYPFGGGKAEGRADMRNLLGGKGAGLAEMANLGLPVPPGFTITTEVCTHYYANGQSYPQGLEADVGQALAAIEAEVGRKFGDKKNPLLVSVRSGAPVSMPGMMDTV